MTGGRLLVLGGPDRDARLLAARLTAPRRRAAAFSPETALRLSPSALPDVAVTPLFDDAGDQELDALLRRWDGLPLHAVFLAAADFDGRAAAGPPLRVFRGLDAGGIEAALGLFEERDAEAHRAEVGRIWREAFQSGFPGFIVVCDEHNRVVYANTALAQRAGSDPLGMPCHKAVHGRPEPCPWCPREAVDGSRSMALEVQSPLDGRFFSTTSTALQLPDAPPLLLSLFYDVTDRNMALGRLKALNRDLERRVAERTDMLSRQAEELAEANTRLRELDALKSGFLATVTHDLRTPLTSVLGFAKLTRRDFVKEFMPFSEVSSTLRRKGARIADNLGIIETEGARLTRLVNDFLDLSKIESGRLQWNDQLIDPARVARAAIDAVGGEYEQNQAIALVVDMPEALPRLRLDPDRLMQVLVNLLTNAVRHTGEGEVTLSAKCLTPQWLEFRVADTGPGIPREERERIFDKFHQARRGDTTPPGRRGTGLGLAICKQIVERYGGSIRAEGREPRGTAFVVELPVAAAAPDNPPPAASGRRDSDLPAS